MYHRYGRHGNHAWKLLQERKYAQKRSMLPVPLASTTTFIRIVVPTTTERVIVLIMPEDGRPDEVKLPDIEIVTGSRTFTPPPELARPISAEPLKIAPGDDTLIHEAKWKAMIDAKTVRGYTREGKYVRINDAKLDDRIDKFTDAYFESLVARGNPPPSPQEYQVKSQRYREAYLESFREGLHEEKEKEQICFYTPIEGRLRELAIQDRNQYPSPWRRPFHQRDLAVIRVLLELDITLDRAIEELEKIHQHADIYERYYANPREEVKWPEQATTF